MCRGFPARPVSRSQGRDHGQPLIAANRTTPGGGNTCSRTSSAARHSPPWGLDQPDGRTRGGSPNVPQPSAGKAAIYSRSLCHLERPAPPPRPAAHHRPLALKQHGCGPTGGQALQMSEALADAQDRCQPRRRDALRCGPSAPHGGDRSSPHKAIGRMASATRYPAMSAILHRSSVNQWIPQRACVPTPSCPWPKPS